MIKSVFPIFIFIVILISCQSSPQIEEGHWTGTLTPMNHPDMHNPIGYEVTFKNEGLIVQIIGPDSSLIPTRNTRVENDTLYFQFNEPEEQVELDCKLGRQENLYKGFVGRCTDESGKWARFTMIPPN